MLAPVEAAPVVEAEVKGPSAKELFNEAAKARLAAANAAAEAGLPFVLTSRGANVIAAKRITNQLQGTEVNAGRHWARHEQAKKDTNIREIVLQWLAEQCGDQFTKAEALLVITAKAKAIDAEGAGSKVLGTGSPTSFFRALIRRAYITPVGMEAEAEEAEEA